MKRVTAAIIENNGRILLARRKKGENNELKWEFPGGKIKENETPEQCLKRELLEEFEINADIKGFICSSQYQYSHISIELLAYKVEYISGEFKLHDHDQIEWVMPAILCEYNLSEADIPIARHVQSL